MRRFAKKLRWALFAGALFLVAVFSLLVFPRVRLWFIYRKIIAVPHMHEALHSGFHTLSDLDSDQPSSNSAFVFSTPRFRFELPHENIAMSTGTLGKSYVFQHESFSLIIMPQKMITEFPPEVENDTLVDSLTWYELSKTAVEQKSIAFQDFLFKGMLELRYRLAMLTIKFAIFSNASQVAGGMAENKFVFIKYGQKKESAHGPKMDVGVILWPRLPSDLMCEGIFRFKEDYDAELVEYFARSFQFIHEKEGSF